jgi:hypothetical protein
MRKRYRVLTLAAIVTLLVVPFGLALSIQSDPFNTPPRAAAGTGIVTSTSISASAVLGRRPDVEGWRWSRVPDGASLVGLGTLLIGLAAAVRRSV